MLVFYCNVRFTPHASYSEAAREMQKSAWRGVAKPLGGHRSLILGHSERSKFDQSSFSDRLPSKISRFLRESQQRDRERARGDGEEYPVHAEA